VAEPCGKGTTNGRVAAYGSPSPVDKSVPRPLRDVQPVRDILCDDLRLDDAEHDGPITLRVAGDADVDQRLIEAGDRSTVHLLVRTVAAMHPHHRGLIAVAV
jgi:hypothetical protein